MLVLGIESSCDETAASIVRDGVDVLSNVIASQHELHAEYGGVVPEIASRAHVERITPVVRRALSEAGVTLRDIDAVAVGNRPGLIGALVVGVSAAKALAWSMGVPLVGVDHVRAHLYAALLRDRTSKGSEGDLEVVKWSSGQVPGGVAPGHSATRPLDHSFGNPSLTVGVLSDAADLFPALGLVISGGHTAIFRCESPLKVTRLGSTIDDAVGEAYDKCAAILGLGHPGGPLVDRLAASGNDRAHDFPVSRLDPESLDFSFSGLKTSVLYAVRGRPQVVRGARDGGLERPSGWQREASSLSDQERADVCASFQRACARVLMLKIERALEREAAAGGAGAVGGRSPVRSLIIGGGVSANSRIRREAVELGARRGVRVALPAMAYCLDNAAMIAGLGHARLAAGELDDLSLAASPMGAV
ncbi:MAG: tRNA (adenosine(37)-N6)-threonylcarbamoyltransferase complex transferase subunit TsaD [Phycisphaerales bacterium]